MPTYIYETIPPAGGAKPRRFELRQSMMDEPLTTDPETGFPVKRVITGGLEIPRGHAGAERAAPPAASCVHSGGCGCH